MNRLIVFSRAERSLHYGREYLLDHSDCTFDRFRIRHPSGDVDILAVIGGDHDVHRYRGLEFHEVVYKDPVSPYCEDHLRAMVRPLPPGGDWKHPMTLRECMEAEE